MTLGNRFLLFLTITVLCAAFIFGFCIASEAPAYAFTSDDLQSNSSVNPYSIDTKEDFIQFAQMINGGETLADYYFVLGADLDFVEGQYVKAGDLNHPFNGYFDAQGHSITIQYNADTADYNGVFGAIGYKGTVKNLTVKGAIKGGSYTGAVAGLNAGRIMSCVNTALVNCVAETSECVGGISGKNTGIIQDCLNGGIVKASRIVGGIVGDNAFASDGNGVFRSVNLGDVSALSSGSGYRMGGIVGTSAAVLADCYNYAYVNGVGAGSVVGYLSANPNGQDFYCYNINAKSARQTVGDKATAVPATFGERTVYQFLTKDAVTFGDGSSVNVDFEAGYGYLPCFKGFGKDAKALLRICLYGDGDGSSDMPFVIKNAEEWQLFVTNTQSFDYIGLNLTVDSTLNLSSVAPASCEATPFNGTFDGGSHIINAALSGINNVGLFSVVGADGVVKNLTVGGSVAASGVNAGAVAGVLYGSLDNVTSMANVTGSENVGAVAGAVYGDGIIRNLTSVTSMGSAVGITRVGGVAGYAYNAVCFNDIVNQSAVASSNTQAATLFGGIFGEAVSDKNVDLRLLFNFGNINSTASYTGGIVGKSSGINYRECINAGNVKGGAWVGGLSGALTDGNISVSGVKADITGVRNLGGLFGEAASADTVVSDSYAVARFYKPGATAVETSTYRILGLNYGTLTRVYYDNEYVLGRGVKNINFVTLTSQTQGIGVNSVKLCNMSSAGEYPLNGIGSTVGGTNMWYQASTVTDGTYPVVNLCVTSREALASALSVAYFDGGDGTADNPFRVATTQQLYNLSYLVNNSNGYSVGNYLQTADIVLAQDFRPIADGSVTFGGKYDGNYRLIEGLNVNTDEDNGGLFGVIANGGTVVRVCVEKGSVTAASYAGGVAGKVNYGGTISKCYSTADVYAKAAYAGGVTGYAAGNVEESFSLSDSVYAYDAYCGGVAGFTDSTAKIIKCFSAGLIKGNLNVGGIVGRNQGFITSCYSSANIQVSSKNGGGIAGNADGSEPITDCYYTGKIINTSASVKGAIVGQLSAENVAKTLKNCYYNGDLAGEGIMPYNGAGSSLGYAKTTANLLNTAFINGFDDKDAYVYGLDVTMDSNYAPRLAVFANIDSAASGALKATEYACESVKLRLFGYSESSSEVWGTESNPYLISTAEQLISLSNLVATYDYNGCFFLMTKNIDMNIKIYDNNLNDYVDYYFTQIGKYISQLSNANCAFEGCFNGGGYTLLGVKITSKTDYCGLFGYVGANGTIKNLIMDADSRVTTTGSWAGSLVGYLKGDVERVVSYAEVTAFSHTGGLIGMCQTNSKIADSLFAGTVNGGEFVYGVIGHQPDSVTVNAPNTWYVYRYEYDSVTNPNGFVAAGKEPYIHNGYGSILYVDKNGAIDFNVSIDDTVRNLYSITLKPDSGFKGLLENEVDVVIHEGGDGANTFYLYDDTSVKAGYTVKFYARFAKYVELYYPEVNDRADVTSGGTKYYYYGQKVELSLKFSYGKFLKIFDYDEVAKDYSLKAEFAGYNLKNSGENIIISFAMPHDLATPTKQVTIELVSAGDYAQIDTTYILVDEAVYNGQNREGTVNLSTETLAADRLFTDPEIKYYYGDAQSVVTAPNNAGKYVIKVGLTVLPKFGYGNLNLGFLNFSFEIYKRTVNIVSAEAEYWKNVVTKTYDSKDYSNSVNVTDNMSSILSNEKNGVKVSSDIKWSQSQAGSGLAVTINNFVLSGLLSANYKLKDNLSLSFPSLGQINRKDVYVTVSEEDKKWTYSDSQPIINNPVYEGSVGEISIKFLFKRLTAAGITDTAWDGISWNVGSYEISIDGSGENNHNINLKTNGEEKCVMVIAPRLITTVAYRNVDNLVYTGSDLSANIVGEYTTLRGKNKVELTFYREGEEVALTEIVNAGNYLLQPGISDPNYLLSSVSPYTLTVAKANKTGSLNASVATPELVVGKDGAVITLSDVDPNASYRAVKRSNAAGGVEVRQEGNSYYLYGTAYGTVTYAIEEYGNPNYASRLSDDSQIVVKPGTIYIGIKDNTFIYGDVVKLTTEYFRDSEGLDKITDTSEISGFIAPKCEIVAQKLNYTETGYDVTIYGAISDGYVFSQLAGIKVYIQKKSVTVYVDSEDQLNLKFYGDSDADISFSTQDSGTGHKIVTLPNGEKVSINGRLNRAAGEAAGSYAIGKGTLLNDNNPNYSLTYSINGDYLILKKEIKLYIPAQSKDYLEKDPIFITSLAEGYSLAFNDTLADSVTVSISRDAGEKVGTYHFHIGIYNGGNNYTISDIINENRFSIKEASPIVSVSVSQSAQYGDLISSLTLVGTASYKGKQVLGSFAWQNGTQRLSTVGTVRCDYVFMTDDANYALVRGSVNVNVTKRTVNLVYTGLFDYTYNGANQMQIQAKAIGLVGEDVLTVKLTVREKEYGKVGVYHVDASVDSGLYALNEEDATKEFRINARVITVTVESAVLNEGDTFAPVISYSGYAAGEGASVLTRKATVNDIPTKSGYYVIMASGAAAENYIFTYHTASLIINAKSVADKDGDITISGTIIPGAEVVKSTVSKTDDRYKDAYDTIKKELGGNLIIPCSQKISEYLVFDYSVTLTGKYNYKVKLSTESQAVKGIYVVNANNEVVKLEEYELTDGALTFQAGEIKSVIVMKDKNVGENILGYVPLVIIVFIVALAVFIIVISVKAAKKKEKRKEKYYR